MTDTPPPSRPEDAPAPAAATPADDWVEAFFVRRDPGAERRAADALAQSVQHTLQVAIVLAKANRPVSLSGLQEWVGRLTASILDLDTADSRQMRPALVGLVTSLDQLEHALRSRAPPQGLD